MIDLCGAIINSVGNYIVAKTVSDNAFCNKVKVLSTVIATVNNYTYLIINGKKYTDELGVEMGITRGTAIFNSND